MRSLFRKPANITTLWYRGVQVRDLYLEPHYAKRCQKVLPSENLCPININSSGSTDVERLTSLDIKGVFSERNLSNITALWHREAFIWNHILPRDASVPLCSFSRQKTFAQSQSNRSTPDCKSNNPSVIRPSERLTSLDMMGGLLGNLSNNTAIRHRETLTRNPIMSRDARNFSRQKTFAQSQLQNNVCDSLPPPKIYCQILTYITMFPLAQEDWRKPRNFLSRSQ